MKKQELGDEIADGGACLGDIIAVQHHVVKHVRCSGFFQLFDCRQRMSEHCIDSQLDGCQ